MNKLTKITVMPLKYWYLNKLVVPPQRPTKKKFRNMEFSGSANRSLKILIAHAHILQTFKRCSNLWTASNQSNFVKHTVLLCIFTEGLSFQHYLTKTHLEVLLFLYIFCKWNHRSQECKIVLISLKARKRLERVHTNKYEYMKR